MDEVLKLKKWKDNAVNFELFLKIALELSSYSMSAHAVFSDINSKCSVKFVQKVAE